jgi:hypothetical protein
MVNLEAVRLEREREHMVVVVGICIILARTQVLEIFWAK